MIGYAVAIALAVAIVLWRRRRPRKITLQVCSWNLGELACGELQGGGNDSLIGEWLGAGWSPEADLVAVAFQEAKEENPGEDEALRKMLHERLGGSYVHVGSSTVRKIQLHVFAAAGVHPNHVASSSLNTARGGTSKTGSKGAATLSLSVGGSSVCFAACHLTAGPDRWEERNEDARRILESLPAARCDSGRAPAGHFDHVLFFGDLNYRVALEFGEGEAAVLEARRHEPGSAAWQAEIDRLLAADQLAAERAKGTGSVLGGFSESPIAFEPTYKWQPGVSPRVLLNKKGQCGSFCDRVLHLSKEPSALRQLSYTAVPELTPSDHTPVSARFEMAVTG